MVADEELLAAARQSASAAATHSRVELRRLVDLDALLEAEALFSAIWGGDPVPMAAHLMQALSASGAYLVGAYERDGSTRGIMLAACVGFWGPPDRPSLHSHIAGVLAGARGRDLGFALKLHQRADALAHGVPVVTWTFDPLIARNAHFNLHKLGGRPVKYAANYYGVMADAINAGDETDRMVVRWELGGAAARSACDGVDPPRPAAPGGVVLVDIPGDIEALRRTDPEQARTWRRTLRDRLVPLLADGGRIVDFDRSKNSYRVEVGRS